MSGMWATPVSRDNYSGISGEGQESAPNSPFPGGLGTERMPHNLPFMLGELYYRFRPKITVTLQL
jgi:hypothetical protein